MHTLSFEHTASQYCSDFIKNNEVNWASELTDETLVIEKFEHGLEFDEVVDFVAVQAYMLNGEAVAWLDYENMSGYKLLT